MCTQYPKRPEGVLDPPELWTGVTDSWGLPAILTEEQNQGPGQEQPAFLPAKPTLQPYSFISRQGFLTGMNSSSLGWLAS